MVTAPPAVTSMKGAFLIMSNIESEKGFVDESKLTDLERTILHDFQLLSEDEQRNILEFITSLLGK